MKMRNRFAAARLEPMQNGGQFAGKAKLLVLVALFLLLGLSCTPSFFDGTLEYQTESEEGAPQLTPSQAYAGEVLAYLLQVVAGHSGQERGRGDWRERGLGIGLDFNRIRAMAIDPESRISKLIVLDPNILGLSEVLYHYNPLLNQFKGRFVFDSLYPSAELMSLRLLLVQKVARKEIVHLEEVVKREERIFRSGHMPTVQDLVDTNLKEAEILLLRDVIQSEPLFHAYYKNPYLIRAYEQIGLIEKGSLTRRARRRTSYAKYRLVPHPKLSPQRAIRIAILPSITREFKFGGSYPDPYAYGFKPTAVYREVVEKLKRAILTSTHNILKAQYNQNPWPIPVTVGEDHAEVLLSLAEEAIAFENHDRRPLVISPQNVRECIGQISPDADLAVIILGKNVYRSMSFDPEPEEYEKPAYRFLDIMDIRYDQIQSEVDAIGRMVVARIPR
jgi:hypothetical protein